MVISESDHFKTQEMCNKAVKKDPYSLAEVPDNLEHKKCVTKQSKKIYVR